MLLGKGDGAESGYTRGLFYTGGDKSSKSLHIPWVWFIPAS